MTSFRSRVSGQLAAVRQLLGALLVVFAGVALGAVGAALLFSFGWRDPLFPSALTGHGTPRPLDVQRAYDRIEPSVLDVTAAARYDDETAEGTAFVIGYGRSLILTNNHVIRGATAITATAVGTGQTYTARLVGADTGADIAVLRLVGSPRLRVAPEGDSRQARLGDQVLVVGNQAGQGGSPTIAPGILNSLDRTIVATDGGGSGFTETLRGMLQTSARIEPGDSGGPLVNSGGQVIGVDTAAADGPAPAGFAIPVDSALAAARRIIARHAGTGSFLGVMVAAGPSSPQAQPHPSLTEHMLARRGDDPFGAGPQRLPRDTPGSPMPAQWQKSPLYWARGVSAGGHLYWARGVSAAGHPPRRVIAAPGRTGGLPGRGAGGRAAGEEGSCLETESEAAVPERVAPDRSGALVEGALCGTPAAAAGLAPGDVIVAAAGRSVASPGALAAVVAGCEPGTALPVTWVDVSGVTRTAMIRAVAAPAP